MNVRNNRGFTLLEVIVVMLIIGIVSVVVATRMMSSNNELIAQTEAIKSHLRYAQSKAMNSNKAWGLRCDGSYYWLYKVNEDNSTAKVVLPGEGAEKSPDADPDTVKLADIGISSMDSFTLSFDSWGTPHTDASASVELTTEALINVFSGGASKTITVTPETGFIP